MRLKPQSLRLSPRLLLRTQSLGFPIVVMVYNKVENAFRDGGPGSPSIPEDKRCADLVRKSLAEWCRRTLGRELPPRAAGPCDCSQRAAPEAAALRVRFLPSRRPHAPWAGQGNARGQNSLRNLGSRGFP